MTVLANVPEWFLSGKPVLRLRFRDFGDDPEQYKRQMHELARELKLGVAVLLTRKVPGAVVQTFLGSNIPAMSEPKLSVTRKSFPWLFCSEPGCKNRVPFPGEMCRDHV